MFGKLGVPELLIILVIVLLIFGAGKLPQIGNAMGKSIGEFRKAVKSGDGDKVAPNSDQPVSENKP